MMKKSPLSSLHGLSMQSMGHTDKLCDDVVGRIVPNE